MPLKRSLVTLTDSEKAACYAMGCRHTGEHQGWSGSRASEGKIQARAFVVVPVKRNGQSRVIRFSIG